MRTLIKLLVILLAVAAGLATGGLAYLLLAFPKVPAAGAMTLPQDPDTIARGRYLAEHVAMCIDCHSERDFSRFAGPIKPGTFGKGGERFDRATAEVPGVIFAPNLTPAAIGSWTDGELFHAVTTGVTHDGRAMFPLMPYLTYGRIAEDDVKAILAYLRTLQPIAHPVPARTLETPVNLIVRTIPQPAAFTVRPSPGDRLKYGQYLTTLASCTECHTPRDSSGTFLPGMTFAGGAQFADPEKGYRVRSANITPDADTGIGAWTEEQFVAKFKGFETPSDHVLSDDERRQNTAMPWLQYAGMTREDLGAIYTYLRTLTPVINRVDKWPDAGK
jgi:mono/diheme cytochrome c family protein